MKRIFFSFIALFISTLSFSQTIKIENGFSFSSMNSEKFDLLNEAIVNNLFAVGVDYFDHKLFYFSSEIGYLKKGGKEMNVPIMFGVGNLEEKWSYLHMNTTLRLKYQINNSHFFIGIGPRFDVLVGSNKFTDIIYSDGYEMNRFSTGGIAELGAVQEINRFRLGVNYSYLINFVEVGKSQHNNVYNYTHLIRFSFGFRLK